MVGVDAAVVVWFQDEHDEISRFELFCRAGDALVLYPDGITEAQGAEEIEFGQERLLGVVKAGLGSSAQELQDSVLSEVRQFVGDAPQFDDITLMVITRI